MTQEMRNGVTWQNLTPQPFFDNQIFSYSGVADGTRVLAHNLGSYVQNGDFADSMQWLNAVGIISPNVGVPAQFAGNTYITNKGSSNYNGLLTSLHKNMSHGLQFDVNYTFSHSIDNSSGIANSISSSSGMGFICDAQNLRTCRGNSDFDITHIVNADFVYDLPFGKGRTFGNNMPGALNQVLGGWNVAGIPTWRSGIAFSTVSSAYLMGYANNAPAIFNGDRNAIAVDAHKTADGIVNLFADPQKAYDAFSGPLGFNMGSRNNLRGPGYVNLDLRVGKRFQINERFNVQFQADAFNALNHPNFSLPGGGSAGAGADITSGPEQFGKITSTVTRDGASARVMQFGLRLEF
jgi:hypothetical protein